MMRRGNIDDALAGVEQLRREHAEMRAMLERVNVAYNAAPDDFGATYEYDEMDALRTVLDDCATLLRYLKGAAVPVAGEHVLAIGDVVRVLGDRYRISGNIDDTGKTVTLVDGYFSDGPYDGDGDVWATNEHGRTYFHPRDLVLVRKAHPTQETSDE